jgi:hypothetical protein
VVEFTGDEFSLAHCRLTIMVILGLVGRETQSMRVWIKRRPAVRERAQRQRFFAGVQ